MGKLIKVEFRKRLKGYDSFEAKMEAMCERDERNARIVLMIGSISLVFVLSTIIILGR